MNENLKVARKLQRTLLENPEIGLAYVEIITRLGIEEFEKMNYTDLEHVAQCTSTYTRCSKSVCSKLRMWRFNNIKQIEQERDYWLASGLVLPPRVRITYSL